MTVPIVAVMASTMNRNIASLIEAKKSTTSRENSSHPRPDVEGPDALTSETTSGLSLMNQHTSLLRPGRQTDPIIIPNDELRVRSCVNAGRYHEVGSAGQSVY